MKPRSVDGPALLCGLAIFMPVPGVRGALFALFPGLAFRNRQLLAAGAIYGFLLDLLFFFVWQSLGLVWEPRGEYNRIINTYLPPEHTVMTHCGCAVPNVVQVVGGLVLWAATFYFLWVKLWPVKLKTRAQIFIPLCGTFLMAISGVITWYSAPLHEWRYWQPEKTVLSSEAFLLLFVTLFPLSSLLVGCSFLFAARASANGNEVDGLSNQINGASGDGPLPS